MPVPGKLIHTLLFVTDLGDMFIQGVKDALLTLSRGLQPVSAVFLRQLYFAGFEAFLVVLVTSLLAGAVIISQMLSIGAGSGFLAGKVMVWLVVRELAPLFTAIIVIARSGTAITAELSQMKIGGEIEFLETLGIPASQYLILPRIAGGVTALVLLSVYFAAGAVLGGCLVASLGFDLPMNHIFQGILSALTLGELAIFCTKSLLFGMAIPLICCREGLSVGKSVTELPQAAKRGVMNSLITVLVLDGAITLYYLLAI